MRAAADVGAAARPLPLFYALSQAGRAIAAARVRAPWRLAGHGLRMPGDDADRTLLKRVVKPAKRPTSGRCHSFSAVAEAIGSDALSRPAQLGALWAAIPDLLPPTPQVPLAEPGWRRPLRALLPDFGDDHLAESVADMMPFQLLLSGLPDGLDPEQLLAELQEYPTAAGAAVMTPRGNQPDPLSGSSVLHHYGPTGERLPTFVWPDVGRHVLERARRLNEIAPDYRGQGARLLIPRLDGVDHLSPLMLWWALLFGLSNFARYDPELWIAALAVDASTLAVPIEEALNVALEALPDLILDALTG